MANDFAAIAKKYNLKLVVLFGSQASGTTGPMSDVDVFVVPRRRLSYEEEDALRQGLALALGASEDKLDLALSYKAGGLLRTQALEKGRVLYGEPGDVLQERVRAWHRREDEKWFDELRHEFLKQTLST